MSFEQCISSPESAGGYSQTSFSATDQLSLLSGMPTPAKSSENEQQTDGFPDCKCGKGTLDCSIHPSTPEKWTAYMRDSLAKTLALLESKQAYLREPDQVFTAKSCASLAWYDQSSCSWRTYQQSLVTDWEPYLETWPRWGMTVGGSAYAHPMSGRTITETDGSYLPTPTTIDAGTGRFNTSVGSSNHRPTLAMMAKKSLWPTPQTRGYTNDGDLMGLAKMCGSFEEMSGMAYRAATKKKTQYWPTPTAHNAKETNAPSESNRNTPTLAAQVGGQLNPDWVGWLMGFPIAWGNLKATAMPKSRSKQQQPTDCSEATK